MPGFIIQCDGKNFTICTRCGNVFNIVNSVVNRTTLHCGCCDIRDFRIRKHINDNFNDEEYLNKQYFYILQKGLDNSYCDIYTMFNMCFMCGKHITNEHCKSYIVFLGDNENRNHIRMLCHKHITYKKNILNHMMGIDDIKKRYEIHEGHILINIIISNTSIPTIIHVDNLYQKYVNRKSAYITILTRNQFLYLYKQEKNNNSQNLLNINENQYNNRATIKPVNNNNVNVNTEPRLISKKRKRKRT